MKFKLIFNTTPKEIPLKFFQTISHSHSGIGKREKKKYVGKLKRVLRINVNLPPLDKYNLFYPANLFSIFSIMLFQIIESLYLAPNGRPKYFIGSEATPHPRMLANSPTSPTSPIGTVSNLDIDFQP
jgi:hypothetical protein